MTKLYVCNFLGVSQNNIKMTCFVDILSYLQACFKNLNETELRSAIHVEYYLVVELSEKKSG